MSKILIILTLLGCDDAVSRCDVLLQQEAAYVSEQACQEAADRLLESSLDKPYPTLVTQCATPDDTLRFVQDVAPPEQLAEATRRLRQPPLIN